MSRKIPYACTGCGRRECKLWRQTNTMACFVQLLCGPCALADQKKPGPIDAEGYVSDDKLGKIDQIGWLVPAVPTEDRETFWGYTSVPEDRVRWWRALPLEGRKGKVPKPPKPPKAAKTPPPTKFLDTLADDPRARQCVAAVEANSNEQQMLWLLWFHISYYGSSVRPWDSRWRPAEGAGRVKTWEQVNPGHLVTICKVGRWPRTARPVCVSVFYARVNGQLVAFYEPTSQLVDHELVREWARQAFPNAERTNAENFHNTVWRIDEANEESSSKKLDTPVAPV